MNICLGLEAPELVRRASRLSLAAILLSSGSAFAQTGPAPAAAESERPVLEDIVVTAQRRAQSQQDVPISITTVTAQTLQASGTNNVLQLERVSPGLQVYQVAGSANPFLRGIGSTQSTQGFESPIALYLDGVYQGSKYGYIFDLPDVERVEVLKGPQGTLFGRNATGGAISITTRDPGHDTVLEAEAGYGRFDEKRAKFYAAGAISDTLTVSLAGNGRWDDGYIYNTTLQRKENPTRNQTLSAKLLWKPTDRLNVRLSGLYANSSDTSGLAYHIQAGTVARADVLGFKPTRDIDQTTVGHRTVLDFESYRYTLNTDYDAGPVKLVSITAYQMGATKSLTDSDASAGSLNYVGSRQPFKQFSQELQLQSNTHGPFEYIVGLYYMYLNERFGDYGGQPGNLISASNVPSPLRPADLQVAGASVLGFNTAVQTRAYAAFAQATYEVGPSTRITAGLRYSVEDKHFTGTLFRYTALPSAGNVNVPLYNGVLGPEPLVFGTTTLGTSDLSKKFSKPTWRLSIDHKFSPDVMVFASYNRGFKSGTYNSTTIPIGAAAQQVPVRPEVLDAYEVGLKSELLDRRVRLNAGGFYYNYSNIQVSRITGGGLTEVQNAAKARVLGLDLDLTALVTDNFKLTGSASILDSKYKNFNDAQIFLPKTTLACPAISTITIQQARTLAAASVPPSTPAAPIFGNCSYRLIASGQPLVFAPKRTASIGGEYTVPFDNGGRLVLEGSMYFNSGYDLVPGGQLAHIGSYEIATASIAYHFPDDRMTIRLWGDNLTDNRRVVYISAQANHVQEVNARPLSYGVSVGFKL